MTGDFKHLLVTEQVHAQIKAHAALLGETLMEYVEKALEARLAGSPIALGQRVLFEPRESHEMTRGESTTSFATVNYEDSANLH